MGDVFDEIQPEPSVASAGDVFDQIQPEPTKPSREQIVSKLADSIKSAPTGQFAGAMAFARLDPIHLRRFILEKLSPYINPDDPDAIPIMYEAMDKAQNDLKLTDPKKYIGIGADIGKTISEFAALPIEGTGVLKTAGKFALQEAAQLPTGTEHDQPWSDYLSGKLANTLKSGATGLAVGTVGKLVPNPWFRIPLTTGGFMGLTAAQGGSTKDVLESGIQVLGYEAVGLAQQGLFDKAREAAIVKNPELAKVDPAELEARIKETVTPQPPETPVAEVRPIEPVAPEITQRPEQTVVPAEVKPVAPQPPETPAPLGNEKPPENDYVKFEGIREGSPEDGIPDMKLYTLKQDIPGHPAGSTLAEETLRAAGVKLPETGAVSVPPQGPEPSGGVPIQETGGKQETIVPPPVNKWATVDEALAAENLLKPLTPGSPESLRAAEIRNQYLPPQKPPTVPPVAAPGMPEPEPPRRLSLTQAKKQGHDIPRILGWTDAQRMDFNKSITGKTSMADMNVKEARAVVDAMKAEQKRLGLEPVTVDTKGPVQLLVDQLNTHPLRGAGEGMATDLHPSVFRRMWRATRNTAYQAWKSFEKPWAFFEALDGQRDGVFTKTFREPIDTASEHATHDVISRTREMENKAREIGINLASYSTKIETVPGTNIKLTADEKVGIYIASLRPDSYKNLVAMGIKPDVIDGIKNSLTPQEKAVGDFMLEQWNNQLAPVRVAANAAGYDIKDIQKLIDYSPIMRQEKDLGQDDYLDDLAKQIVSDTYQPPSGFLIKRTGSAGKQELSSLMMYMRNAARIEQFIQMAPIGRQLGRILNNPDFKQSLRDHTWGYGNKLLSNWLHDSIRGSIKRDTEVLSRVLEAWRSNAVGFALDDNFLVAAKMTAHLAPSLAEYPKAVPYISENFVRSILPGSRKQLLDFVYSHSSMMETRTFERDVRQGVWNKESATRQLQGKNPQPLRKRLLGGWDRTMAAAVWKGFYDYKFEGTHGDMAAATKFADYETSTTQPKANVKDLPPIFRGGLVGRLLTTFGSATNTMGNYWANRIVKAKYRGEIGWGTAAYRTAVSVVLPAVFLGFLSRGRLPKTWGETGEDLLAVPFGPLGVIGRWIIDMAGGASNPDIPGTTLPKQIGSFIGTSIKMAEGKYTTRAQRAKATRQLITGGLNTAAQAAGTKYLPSMAEIRAMSGIYDLATGQTDDPRRLMYSDWTLNKGKEGSASERGR